MIPLIGRFDQVSKSTHLVSGGRDTNADTDDPFIATARHAERCYFFSNRFSQLQGAVEWRIVRMMRMTNKQRSSPGSAGEAVKV